MNRPKFYVYLPVVFALILILGVFIGRTLNRQGALGAPLSVEAGNSYSKIEEILRYIEQEYVDTVKNDDLVEKTITSMLENLDPHSSYITAEELQANNEPLQGNFEGIGVEFNIINDTIRVIAAIPGGPAEKVGVKAGDKIVTVDGQKLPVKVSNKDVMTKLKGKGGTKVKVGILRKGRSKIQDFTITRGTIPIYSIDIAYMISPKTGYIKISRFAATTYDEYMAAFEKLQKQGMQQLVVDLRGNGGGYLNTAVDIADEFLSDGKEIVYTMGKARPRKDYKATSKGSFENGKIMILIDDGSASASEILAGAIQDNDRGIILGRRSFGKGLVQEQSEFTDGSAMRLTIARYYTPTGRCIQKPYTEGLQAYYEEEYNRYTSGELESADSIKQIDSLKFVTPGGKIVYGGGGIMPDVFVGLDTSGRSHYLTEVSYNGILNDFAFDYTDRERSSLQAYKTPGNFQAKFVVTESILRELVDYAAKQGIKPNEAQIRSSEALLKMQLKALIARNVWNNEGFYPVFHSRDNVLKKALELMK